MHGGGTRRIRATILLVAIAVGAPVGCGGGGTVSSAEISSGANGASGGTGAADAPTSSGAPTTSAAEETSTTVKSVGGRIGRLDSKSQKGSAKSTTSDDEGPGDDTGTEDETAPDETDPDETTDSTESDDIELAEGTISQWASSASATSSYGVDGGAWSTDAVLGEPDVDPECRDDGKAWASKTKDEVAVLTLYYDQPVVPTEFDIYQTYNPGQISQIDLIDVDGTRHTMYQGDPAEADGCPVQGFLREIDLGVVVNGIEITVDQSVLGTGWAEIDAVALIGYPSAS